MLGGRPGVLRTRNAGLGGEARRLAELTAHLAARELTARHRFTLLGWLWPLARQLAQFGVLLAVFTSVVELGIDDYPAFLLTGLVIWTWFSSGLSEGTTALRDHRHLLFRPRCPAAVLPVAAVAVASVDALLAVPVLLLIVALESGLHASLLLLPVLASIQLVLVCGLAWLASAITVYLRDVAQLVVVGLLLLFYLTPVFYDADRVPDDFEWAIRLNPLTPLLEAYRDVLVGGRLPDPLALTGLAAGALASAAIGLLVFQRLRPGFVDEL